MYHPSKSATSTIFLSGLSPTPDKIMRSFDLLKDRSLTPLKLTAKFENIYKITDTPNKQNERSSSYSPKKNNSKINIQSPKERTHHSICSEFFTTSHSKRTHSFKRKSMLGIKENLFRKKSSKLTTNTTNKLLNVYKLFNKQSNISNVDNKTKHKSLFLDDPYKLYIKEKNKIEENKKNKALQKRLLKEEEELYAKKRLYEITHKYQGYDFGRYSNRESYIDKIAQRTIYCKSNNTGKNRNQYDKSENIWNIDYIPPLPDPETLIKKRMFPKNIHYKFFKARINQFVAKLKMNNGHNM